MNRCLRLLALLALLVPAAWAEPIILADCESPAGWKTNGAATVAPADSAAVGQGAIRINLPGATNGSVVRELGKRPLPGSAAWDRYQGLSFQVKGDGSDNWGCLAVGQVAEGSYTFVTYFPLKDTSWHKLTVPWADFVPEGPWDPIGTAGALPPSGITTIRCGSRWTIGHNNYPLPACSFGLDQIALEETVPAPAAAPALRPFSDAIAKLKAKQPVRIICMGDSITAGTSLPDREQQRYAVGVQRRLRQWFGEQVSCESHAVGGAKLTDARAWVARDLSGPPPDLVTVLYGYNDKSNTFTREAFKRSLADYLARIARQTGGRSAVLLLATLPGTGPRFVMMDDFAEAVRETGAEQHLPVCDLAKVFKTIGRDAVEDYFADMAHPNAEGHELLADALARYLAQAAGVNPPVPPAPPAVPGGEAKRWSFGALDGWKLDGADVSLADGELRYAMKAPAGDHRRAWSPVVAVKPGQRYRVAARVFCGEPSSANLGLYVGWYPTLEAAGEAKLQPVRSAGNVAGFWEPLAGTITVPEGAGAMTVLVWASRESTGAFRIDDVTVEPK